MTASNRLKKLKHPTILLITAAIALYAFGAYAENIDTSCQYAWAENVGWINFKPSQGPGVTVTDTTVTGMAWGENIGWINLSPANGGVINDGKGNLSGYAWAENVGWINFKPANGGVSIGSDGKFSGYAWGENIGWINFGSLHSCVKTAWAPQNSPPFAGDQTITTAEDTSVGITLGASDPEGGTLTFTVVSAPSHGALSGIAPNLTYSPDANYNGQDSFTFKANDGLADSNVATVTIAVMPVNDAPVANAGVDQTVEATSSSGASVTLNGTGSNDPDGAISSYSWSGSFGTIAGATPAVVLPIGTHTITLTVTDNGGLTAGDSVQVIVQDTMPPVIAVPGNITAEATGPSGAAISYTATAADVVSGVVAPSCAPVSGSTFALGTTTVICSAVDGANNSASASFTVTIVDTTPPVILAPGDIIAESPEGSSVPVSFYVTAADAVDGTVAATCSPASGSNFPIGVSTVNCTATDTAGHMTAAAFHIIVTTNPARSGGGTVPPDTGGTITTPDGSVSISIPQGALTGSTYISVAETGTDYELTSNLGNGTAVYGVAIEPHGATFNTPVTITFTWPDMDNDGTIDGSNIKEQNVIITKNNVALTGRCKDEPGPLDVAGAECNTALNYFKFKVSSLSVFALVFVDDQGPLTSNVTAIPSPAPVNIPITITAVADDTLRGGSTIEKAEYKLDNGDYIAMNASDGAFNSIGENVNAVIPAFTEPGVHSICVRAWDSLMNVAGPEECLFLPVYDPSEGFVTGGGWIISPAGAYILNPDLMGKATFGFVSKYQKGATVPTGQTEFQFKVANLNFHSDSYEWLVVAGARAQYKGTGTINGLGAYGFMLTAIDGNITGGGGSDKFRIKIWDKASDSIVYDNQIGSDNTADPSTLVEGGSIVIHKK